MEKGLVNFENHTVYLAIGSNIGDKTKNLKTAIEEIDILIGQVTEVSSFFENEPQGFKSNL